MEVYYLKNSLRCKVQGRECTTILDVPEGVRYSVVSNEFYKIVVVASSGVPLGFNSFRELRKQFPYGTQFKYVGINRQ
jgi:hypothetical protein